MEHLEHFGLTQDPFQNNPQLAFYFASPQHTDAERRLLRGVRQGKGLSVIVGASGSGKTTLVSHLMEGLDEDAFEASLIVMVHTGVDSKWLLACIARQLGVEEPAATRVALVGQIFRQLVAIREEGRRPVIVIDEAQMLTRKETQTELRGLLNLEWDEERLLSLVLSGLPELEQTLALDPPLAERVDIRVELACLDAGSASAYLAHRVRTAGGDPEILHPQAMARVAELSEGIPRRLNTLADNALFEAYLAGRGQVSVEDVDRAAQDLSWARKPEPEPVAVAPPPALEPPPIEAPPAPQPVPVEAPRASAPPVFAAAAVPQPAPVAPPPPAPAPVQTAPPAAMPTAPVSIPAAPAVAVTPNAPPAAATPSVAHPAPAPEPFAPAQPHAPVSPPASQPVQAHPVPVQPAPPRPLQSAPAQPPVAHPVQAPIPTAPAPTPAANVPTAPAPAPVVAAPQTPIASPVAPVAMRHEPQSPVAPPPQAVASPAPPQPVVAAPPAVAPPQPAFPAPAPPPAAVPSTAPGLDADDMISAEDLSSVAAEVEAVLGEEPDLESAGGFALPDEEEDAHGRTAVIPDGGLGFDPFEPEPEDAPPGSSPTFNDDSLDHLFVNLVEKD